MAALAAALVLASPAFANGGTIPKRYTCDGANISPALRWTAPPHGTASFSLTVFDMNGDSDDVQARGRVTYIANTLPMADDDEDPRERYFRYFPSSRQYAGTHDFQFFRLEPVRIRFIGGFGQIYWIDPSEFMMPNPFSPAQELRIIQHMNDDHRDALARYAGGNAAVMAGIDAEGFDVLQAGKKIRFAFDTPVRNMEDARQALVAMANRPA